MAGAGTWIIGYRHCGGEEMTNDIQNQYSPDTRPRVKTITMMELRASPGEYAFRVRADRETFIVTYQGKPCFKMVPVDEATVILPDGTIKGPKPLTMGLDLGGEYGVLS